MDSFEWNKIAGGVLGTLMFVVILKIAAGAIFEVPEPAKPGYVVAGVTEDTTGGSAAPVEELPPDWGTVLAKADIAQGKTISGRCEQCHDLSKGGPNKIGPNLWGIVGRARASLASFDYSSAMKSAHDVWDFDRLFKYLKSPQSMVPGTKMNFAGIPKADDRVNLIAYLRTLSDSPMAIPAPKPAAATPAPVDKGTAPAGTPAATTPSTTKGAATGTPTTTPTGQPAATPGTPTTGVTNKPK